MIFTWTSTSTMPQEFAIRDRITKNVPHTATPRKTDTQHVRIGALSESYKANRPRRTGVVPRARPVLGQPRVLIEHLWLEKWTVHCPVGIGIERRVLRAVRRFDVGWLDGRSLLML